MNVPVAQLPIKHIDRYFKKMYHYSMRSHPAQYGEDL